MVKPSFETQGPIITFTCDFTEGIKFSLSRYQRRWFLVFSDYYQILDPPSARIYRVLNQPRFSRNTGQGGGGGDEKGSKFFWFNPTVPTNTSTSSSSSSFSNWKTYNFSDPATTSKKDKNSALLPIQMLLDAKPPVVRMTGRMRAETSEAWGVDEGQQTVSYEMEVLVPDEGLLRQCYYCLEWEGLGRSTRFKKCGDDLFWCESCQANGWFNLSLSSTFGKLWGQDDEWRRKGHNIYIDAS
ncbi:hypothetical protein K435DRAFT_812122 [Dendrothele bispora CBS 962.96]|uniref:Uncharacterized protein n=1 Tax=Dendrothele bispora (strain CBS 962.96) TaxID=1314807 RepID=A0A4S8KR24_DENBC|nr:hypothetical protein K435DRAFT_812122 [Dendrothele bispora CBS 962.96]